MKLTKAQQLALSHVDQLSKGSQIDSNLRVTLNFHPDSIQNGFHILELLAKTGIYKSQFETRTSNGGLTAHPGGDRWIWESRIFGQAYDSASASERPKYGALNYKFSHYGGSPRFGSAHLRLVPKVLYRTTFCYPDSVFEPEAFGTAKHMVLVELALNEDRDLLDDYIEAHVHGELDIIRDVEALVLDPSYKNTYVEELANKLGCKVEWHAGFTTTVSEIAKYPDYRGIDSINLAKEICKDEILTPYIIGLAAATGKYNQQSLKLVWHYLARFGQIS